MKNIYKKILKGNKKLSKNVYYINFFQKKNIFYFSLILIFFLINLGYLIFIYIIFYIKHYL